MRGRESTRHGLGPDMILALFRQHVIRQQGVLASDECGPCSPRARTFCRSTVLVYLDRGSVLTMAMAHAKLRPPSTNQDDDDGSEVSEGRSDTEASEDVPDDLLLDFFQQGDVANAQHAAKPEERRPRPAPVAAPAPGEEGGHAAQCAAVRPLAVDADVAPAQRSRRAGADGWPRLVVSQAANAESFIRLSVNASGSSDMRASCGFCKKTLSRTCKPDAKGQGRPLGLLGAWLARGAVGSCVHADVWPIAFPERVAGRQLLEALEGSADVFGAERAIDDAFDDPSGEPRHVR